MNNSYKDILAEYEEYLKISGHAKRGIEDLKKSIYRFFDYLEVEGLELTDINVSNAHLYQKWLIETGSKKGGKYTNRTIISYLHAAKYFYNFLKHKKLIHSNPFSPVRIIREERKVPRNLPKEKELSLLLDELSKYYEESNLTDQIRKYKVHVASELMYATGLRSAEAASLKPEDIDFDRGVVNLPEGKGGLSRVCYLNEYAKNILHLYITKMREFVFTAWNEGSDTLFGVKHARFNSMMNKELKKVTDKIGFKTFTSHCYRHCLGYHFLKAGCDVRYIQEILGHKRITSTEVYTKIDKEDLKAVFDKYHPRTFNKRDREI